MVLLMGDKDRRIEVRQQQLSKFPYNCIGLLQYKHKSSTFGIKFATGFLISNRLVLTVANAFFMYDKNEEKMVQLQPISSSFPKNYQSKKVEKLSKIKRVNINAKYANLKSKIQSLQSAYQQQQQEQRQQQIKKIHDALDIQIVQYDYALIELQQKMERSQYFQLSSSLNNTNSNTKLTLSGYSQYDKSYRLFTHSTLFAQISNQAIYYDIDTLGGQAGSPVYISGSNKLVAIHKGYQPQRRQNMGVKITDSLIKQLQQWCYEMNVPFRNNEDIKNKSNSIQNFQSKPQLPNKIFPYNCVGRLTKGKISKDTIAVGFLISQCFALTSASKTFQIIKSNKLQPTPLTFFIYGSEKAIQVQSSRINPKFVEILRQIQSLQKQKEDPNSSPLKKRKKQSEIDYLLRRKSQFDYCLLKIAQKISLPHYFDLQQNISSKAILGIAGYNEGSKFVTCSGRIIDMIDQVLYYKMEVAECQSGSPVFLEKTHNLVGIHQGFSKQDELSFATMISSEVIEQLRKWCFEMMPRFKISY